MVLVQSTGRRISVFPYYGKSAPQMLAELRRFERFYLPE
jgi:hypothetical protein